MWLFYYLVVPLVLLIIVYISKTFCNPILLIYSTFWFSIVTLKIVPPFPLSNAIEPPNSSSTILFTVMSPIPVPFFFVVNWRLNTLAWFSCEIPDPLSVTSIVISVPELTAEIATRGSFLFGQFSNDSMAFAVRFKSSWWRRMEWIGTVALSQRTTSRFTPVMRGVQPCARRALSYSCASSVVT